MESTSSVISLWRSATSVSTDASTSSVSSRVRVAFCCPPVSLVAMVALRCCSWLVLIKSYPPGTTIRVRRTGALRSGPGDRVHELLSRGRRLEQRPDVLPGAAQRLHRRNPHQVLPAQVEHHRVPRRRGHLRRVPAQALPAEEGAGIDWR